MRNRIDMTTDAPPSSARDLERTIRRLRSEEPLCSPRQRTSLLVELAKVSADVERMILRDELGNVSPQEDTDVHELERCAIRLQRLMTYWPEPIGVPVAA